jgi:preprotein translocase subunit SecA
MIQAILKKLFGTRNDREIKKMRPLIEQIGSYEPAMKAKSDAELRAQTALFRQKLANGAPLDDLLPEAFATVREAAWRTLGMRHYDVQLIGGIALHRGMIAEMKTGEGKTLVGTSPVYLNALTGRGVHVVTVNDYLASRDAEWMGQVYRFLDMSVGIIVSHMPEQTKVAAYQADITYGQNNEFGFDFLRDNMKLSLERCVQRPLHFAIVDEVDSILIDEARTPLIISGSAQKSSELYTRVNDLIRPLKRDQDFIVDEKAHTVTLTEVGVDKLERKLRTDNLYGPENGELLHHVHQALKAHNLYKRDQNYLVEDGKVVIVDEFTGRKMAGRRWSDGLHQAVEAKEGLRVQEENQTLATITFQNYFRQYEKLAGMTGTADTEAEEFASIYNLEVLVVPPNRGIQRKDDDDVVYTKERGKVRAIIDDIVECHGRGQPVLVGTTSVDKSEFISKLLERDGIPHHVLNAKQHEREAYIIAQAGRLGAVTIATNMAGRGTDILLGGNPQFLARQEVGPEATAEDMASALERFKVLCQEEREKVLAAGGLRIIGTERHESRRIDNQLRGRAGRQGDPGSSQFYLSLEDDLLRIFNAERIQSMMATFKVPDDEPIIHRWVTKAIENAQRKVEARNFDIRKNLLEYDDVMNQQRQSIYNLRREILKGAEVQALLAASIKDTMEEFVNSYIGEASVNSEDFDLNALVESLNTTFRVQVSPQGLPQDAAKLSEVLAQRLQETYISREATILNNICAAAKYEVEQRYQYLVLQAEQRGEAAPPAPVVDEPKLREVKLEEWRRWIRERYLQTVDQLWVEHLQIMAQLKEGIHLQAYAQKDPKIIYKQEAFELFTSLIGLIRRRVVETVFQQEVRSEAELARDIETRRAALQKQLDQARQVGAEQQAAARAAQVQAAQQAALRVQQAQAAQQAALRAQQQAEHAARAQQALGVNRPAPAEGTTTTVAVTSIPAAGQAATTAVPAEGGAAAAARVQPVRRERPKVGRNDPCYCGSGKKYKKCHLPQDEGEDAVEDDGESASAT